MQHEKNCLEFILCRYNNSIPLYSTQLPILRDNPILIGGDFNLPMTIAKEIMEDKTNWTIPISEGNDPSGSRKQHIDYFLVYKLLISNVTYKSLTLQDPDGTFSKSDSNQITDNETVQVDPNKLLDHTPLLADLDLGNLAYGTTMVNDELNGPPWRPPGGPPGGPPGPSEEPSEGQYEEPPKYPTEKQSESPTGPEVHYLGGRSQDDVLRTVQVTKSDQGWHCPKGECNYVATTKGNLKIHLRSPRKHPENQ